VPTVAVIARTPTPLVMTIVDGPIQPTEQELRCANCLKQKITASYGELEDYSFHPALIFSKTVFAFARSPFDFVFTVIRTSICGSMPASGLESV
jgi:hypothetical protein